MRNGQFLPAVGLAAVMVLSYMAYVPGLTGVFQFDDEANLSGLALVGDLSTARDFIASGWAGPLGRPLALASFLLNAPSWPTDPADFLFTNVLIHLANGLLAAWLGIRVARFRADTGRPEWIGCLVALLWVGHPLLVSTNLFVVQRMTSLSAMFVFLGLIGFVVALSDFGRAKRRSLVLMSISLGVGTACAALAKENGALLPVYAWVLESTLLRQAAPRDDRDYRRWRGVFLLFPTLVLVIGLAAGIPHFATGYSSRPFTLVERLLTEARVLWSYIGLTILPTPSSVGPYHDDFVVSSSFFSPPSTVWAVATLVLLAGLSVWVRGRFPLLAFSVLWFLLGMSIESGPIALELYFEHRNYLPLFGLVLAVALFATSAPRAARRLIVPGLVAIGGLFLFVTLEVTRTWGDPLVAARLWFDEHPKSERAAQAYARQLLLAGRHSQAAQAILTAYENIPSNATLALQSLQVTCGVVARSDFERLLTMVKVSLGEGRPTSALANALYDLQRQIDSGVCDALSEEDLIGFAEILKSNERVRRVAQIEMNLSIFQGAIFVKLGRWPRAVSALRHPYSQTKAPEAGVLYATALAKTGRCSDAQGVVSELDQLLKRNPIKRSEWLRAVAGTRQGVDRLITEGCFQYASQDSSPAGR